MKHLASIVILVIIAMGAIGCASAKYTTRVLHSDTRKPISGVTLHLLEGSEEMASNGWPKMDQIDRGMQTTDESGECVFRVKTPGYCSVYPVPFMEFDYTDRPSEYFEESTGVHVLFLRPKTHE